ncbi:MAG: LysR family transcriptional regulator [Rhizobiales bacterium PAR1]|nr:MAG: LysR family transcriptional regulator [Rhizobiales bacterium PAR1]
MDWDNVRAFLAVARQGQFLGASRALRVNQATVARRITALEGALQATLFERSTTGVNLTEAGRRLLSHAERMESEMLQAEADLRQQDIHLSGPVRIGAPDGFTTYFLVPALNALLERHPGIDIQLVPMPLAVSLARREVDIAITLDEPEAGRVVARKLTDYSLGVFGSRAYLDRMGRPEMVEDLARHRLIGYVETYAFSSALNYVEDLLGGHRTAFECASAVGQVEAVRHGLGLGVLHHFIAAAMPDVEPVLPERRAQRSYWLVIHEDVRALGRIRAVVDHIVAEATQRRSAFNVPARMPKP